MRQLFIQSPTADADHVQRLAADHEAANLVRFPCRTPDGDAELLIAHLSNARIEPFLRRLDEVGGVRVTLDTRDVMPLRPPPGEAPEQVTNVQARSPVEIFLGGLQSIGSWRGFLAYAALAGVVVWIGLVTETIYLLTAAMLIAPFAGPAMNLALATARGDVTLLWRSAARYAASLAVAVGAALALSLVLGPEVPTALVIDRSQVSSAAVLLPIAAGVAGAVNLSQSQSNSLVSGAATGVLVAASLAPPAGVIGIGAAIGRWDLAGSGLFLLLLQLIGINLSGALVFRLFGLSPRGARYDRGRPRASYASWLLTGAALAGLLTYQLSTPVALQRSTLAQRMLAEVHKAVSEVPDAQLVEATVRFTRADIPGQESLLCEIFVQGRGSAADDDDLRARVTDAVLARLSEDDAPFTPLAAVTVVRRSESRSPLR